MGGVFIHFWGFGREWAGIGGLATQIYCSVHMAAAAEDRLLAFRVSAPSVSLLKIHSIMQNPYDDDTSANAAQKYYLSGENII